MSIQDWFILPTTREQRRYLEAHPELLSPASEQFFQGLMTQYAQDKGLFSQLRQYLYIFQDSILRGGTAQAIREAFVNVYGGLVLDLPNWMEEVVQKLNYYYRIDASEQTKGPRLLYLHAVLGLDALDPNDPHVPQEARAELQYQRAYTLLEGNIESNKEQILGDAIALCHLALQVYTRERYPYRYSLVHTTLAYAHQKRDMEREVSLQQAIVHYEEALQTLPLAIASTQWADVHLHLGDIYLHDLAGEERLRQEPAIAHCRAALQVYTRDVFPEKWANTLSQLGNIYQGRFAGSSQENIEQAIFYCMEALQVFTRDAYLERWADTIGYLGMAYRKRIIGDKNENLEHAITCFEQFLQVYTHDPKRRAIILSFLGPAYADRTQGNRRVNLEQAVICCKEVSEFYTQETFPDEWVRNSLNLAGIYTLQLIEGLRDNPQEVYACYTTKIQQYAYETSLTDWAYIQRRLGEICERWLKEPEYAQIERAIEHYNAALQVYNRISFPVDWAYMQLRLGCTYRKGHPKELHENMERSLAYFEAALQVYTYETFPEQWALVQQNLGMAYTERFAGKPRLNQEKAIACCNAALRVYTREAFPDNYAEMQMNLGARYMARIVGDRQENQERAIACYTNVLQIHTQNAFPIKWAMLQNNLGILYSERIAGDRAINQEQAFRHHNAALQVYTREAFPVDWAKTHHNLAMLYTERVNGKHKVNLADAVACCWKALEIRTLTAFPDNHGRTQFRLALIEAERGRWSQVHEALTQCKRAQDTLLAMSVGVTGRDTLLSHGYTASVYDAFAQVRLGDIAGAAVTIEQGRARSLAEALNLNTADPDRIQDANLRSRYIDARQVFLQNQALLNALSLPDQPVNEQRFHFIELTERCRKAKEEFDKVINEIHAHSDMIDFLEDRVDAETILQAAQCGGNGHALVYLAATTWGGIAVAAFETHQEQPLHGPFSALELPLLTAECLNELIDIQVNGKMTYIPSSFARAQLGQGFDLFCSDWPGNTFREKSAQMHATCAAEKRDSTLFQAAQLVLHMQEFFQIVEQPLETLSTADKSALQGALNRYFLQLELQRCLPILAKVALGPLMTWLQKQSITSLTLIPCGTLAAFPLSSVLLENRYTVGEVLPTSVAPNARSLLRSAPPEKTRSGIYTLGDPRPTQIPLLWGEAEAHILAKLARSIPRTGVAKVQWEATRPWFLQALQKGYVVDASCHGSFNSEAPLESALTLAGGQYLKLGEMLSYSVDIRGLRLLILSSCQTAIVHLQRTPDEVRSLAAGMIQAGAMAVLAALWSVNDLATYLLIVRFAQEWFPHMDYEPPATAFVRAQHWLRTVTNRELREWEARDVLWPTEDERHEAGSERQNVYTHPTSELVGTLAIGSEGNDRYEAMQARDEIRVFAKKQADPDDHPYANPIYWAGFQITGW